MSVARVTELSCTSNQSFEDAIRQGMERAMKTLRGVRGAWIKEQRDRCRRRGPAPGAEAASYSARLILPSARRNRPR